MARLKQETFDKLHEALHGLTDLNFFTLAEFKEITVNLLCPICDTRDSCENIKEGWEKEKSQEKIFLS